MIRFLLNFCWKCEVCWRLWSLWSLLTIKSAFNEISYHELFLRPYYYSCWYFPPKRVKLYDYGCADAISLQYHRISGNNFWIENEMCYFNFLAQEKFTATFLIGLLVCRNSFATCRLFVAVVFVLFCLWRIEKEKRESSMPGKCAKLWTSV